MERSVAETLMGAIVLAVGITFGFFAYNTSGVNASSGGSYPLQASFDTVDGISSGSDVRIGGVKVGVVNRVDLDTKTYRAVVHFQLREQVKIPTDTAAAIVSESLLGGKYLSLTPGGDEENLAANGRIAVTQSSVNLESLIGRFMFSGADKKEPAAEAPKGL
jgi:phospholipid/cholesterol/gamma-HCH transport system substrate-binding protein